VCSVFRVTLKTIHLISSVYFAAEEINRNSYILPNTSLIVKIECNLIADNVKRIWSLKKKEIIPNYYCKNQRRYLIVLTGPIWITSYILGPFLYFSQTPEVSQRGLHLLKYNLTTVWVSEYQGWLKGREFIYIHILIYQIYRLGTFFGKNKNFMTNGQEKQHNVSCFTKGFSLSVLVQQFTRSWIWY
jgi:hypothetical protein